MFVTVYCLNKGKLKSVVQSEQSSLFVTGSDLYLVWKVRDLTKNLALGDNLNCRI